jgi:hypothetical protein
MDICKQEERGMNMKNNLESIMIASSLLLFGLLWTPITSIGVGIYGVVLGASVLLGVSLSIRQKRVQEEHKMVIDVWSKMSEQQKHLHKSFEETYKKENETVVHLLTDGMDKQQMAVQHSFEIIQQQLGRLNDTESASQEKLHSIAHLLTNFEGSNQAFQQTLKQSISSRREDDKENAAHIVKQLDLLKDSVIRKLTTIQVEITQLNQQAVETVVSALGDGNKEVCTFYTQQSKEMTRLIDAVQDLDLNIGKQSGQVIDALEEGRYIQTDIFKLLGETVNGLQKRYETHRDLLEDYQKKVVHASEDIEEFRNHIQEDLTERLEELKGLINLLTNAIDQLTDSKHEERQRVLEVQTKLSSQFERLVQRG